MEGFLRRIKDAHIKEREAVAEPTQASESLSRRDFFRRYAAPAAATVALSAVPSILKVDAAEAKPLPTIEASAGREAVIESKVAAARAAMNAPDVLEARMGNGNLAFTRVLRALQCGITPQYVKGTRYDMEDMRRKHCVQLSWQNRGEGKPYDVQLSTQRAPIFKTPKQAGYANGVFFGAQNRFLTARHAMCDALQKPRTLGKRDLEWHFTGETKGRPEQVLFDDPTLTNAAIDGAFVSIEGIDPDQTADSEGYKSYPGVAMRLTRGFIDKVFPTLASEYKEVLSRSFVVAIPAGEGTGATAKDKPGSGMTGAPVYTIHNGKKVLAGVLNMISSHPNHETGSTFDYAFFQGIEEVRAQIQEQTRTGA